MLSLPGQGQSWATSPLGGSPRTKHREGVGLVARGVTDTCTGTGRMVGPWVATHGFAVPVPPVPTKTQQGQPGRSLYEAKSL